MINKSIKKKLKITKKGKVIHRVPGQGHNKSNKRTPQRYRKKEERKADISDSKAKELMHNQA